jgi:tetratricopeptide (TPR) repeat protein
VECFEQSLASDPNYARAYAGLADSYAMISSYNIGTPSDLMPKARAAALRALEIDDKLVEAHASLAVIAQNYDWDWNEAEKEYQRSIELDPNYATAHHWYAEYLSLLGRFDDAFVEIERARRLDPLSLIISSDYAAILYYSRQYDRSIEQFRAVLDMEPNFPRAHVVIGPYVEKKMFKEAIADIEDWRRAGDSPWAWAMQAYVYGSAGNQREARRAFHKLEQVSRSGRTDPSAMVSGYIGLGNKDLALLWLEKSVSEHSPALTSLKVNPLYDSLRNDPRFQKQLRRVGLAQ